MSISKKTKPVLRVSGILLLIYLGLVAFMYFRQRSLLYFPTHDSKDTALVPWSNGPLTIGYCHPVTNPGTIWLMTHGNGGQAADRDYVLPHLSDNDSLYVLEYPGYGARPGSPSLQSMNAAASDAYRLLRSQFPHTPVCLLGESIGSGPACALANEKFPPDKIVLVVPFDSLAGVASGHYPFLPVRLLLLDAWDNAKALNHYQGPVEIFAAKDDTIVPFKHAKALAAQVATAHLIQLDGGHNDWSDDPNVKIRR